jgi:hypothetical protein
MSELNELLEKAREPEEPCGCHEWGGDEYVNVGRVHFALCHTHRYWWRHGSNLFSSWRDETVEDWRKNAEMLDRDYVEHPERKMPEDDHVRACLAQAEVELTHMPLLEDDEDDEEDEEVEWEDDDE